ncbi:hypothetical protein HPG69_007394 [Diceros bicornis minor]|uniref:V-SNARE coiled-coil homology domain-containing protein n=1 Tax=Diceros bicornis minor TaxID=77932 RepID=A0A7J7E7B9_DICBM|nr:hypothetical protein HPG69_007394 [Diceros bicornis minor]
MSTGAPAGSSAASGSSRRLQQTQNQVDEVVDIMRVNVDKGIHMTGKANLRLEKVRSITKLHAGCGDTYPVGGGKDWPTFHGWGSGDRWQTYETLWPSSERMMAQVEKERAPALLFPASPCTNADLTGILGPYLLIFISHEGASVTTLAGLVRAPPWAGALLHPPNRFLERKRIRVSGSLARPLSDHGGDGVCVVPRNRHQPRWLQTGLTEQLAGDSGFGGTTRRSLGRQDVANQPSGGTGTTESRGETRNVETTKPPSETHKVTPARNPRVLQSIRSQLEASGPEHLTPAHRLPCQAWQPRLRPSSPRAGPSAVLCTSLFLSKLQCGQYLAPGTPRPATSHRGSAVEELVSGRPFSWASWAALACRWARAVLECRHLGEPQRQLNSLPLMSQKRSP